MRKMYEAPAVSLERFEANEYVAACYSIVCVVGDNEAMPTGVSWSGEEYGPGVYHSSHGTADTCADASANYITVSNGRIVSVEELNGEQGWLNGSVEGWIDRDNSGTCTAGDVIVWSTYSNAGTANRRWNHWGYAQASDAAHPNHS